MQCTEGVLWSRRPSAVLGCLLVLISFSGFLVQAEDQESPGDKPPIDPMHPLYRPLELAYKSREALNEVTDYEAIFTKTEFLPGKPQPVQTTMKLKLREEPFSVYLLFLSPKNGPKNPNEGREVIYVQGRNNNQLQAHGTGVSALVGTVSLDPKSPTAMADSKYPVTMIGMKRLLEKVIEQWENEGKYGECKVDYYPEAKLGDVPCLAIESKHPQPRDEFKFHMTRLYLDDATQYPIRVEQFAFPRQAGQKPLLVEEYTYSELKVNSGLKDRDFDIRNPSYAFPK